MSLTVAARAELACCIALANYRDARRRWREQRRQGWATQWLRNDALYYRGRWDALRAVLDG